MKPNFNTKQVVNHKTFVYHIKLLFCTSKQPINKQKIKSHQKRGKKLINVICNND